MKLLEDRIKKEGRVLPGNILKVDSFLNHQIDVDLYRALGEEWFRLFRNENVTKILTIEASGIGLAVVAAEYFHVPVVFAKKSKSKNIGDDLFSAGATSFTHGYDYSAVVSKRYLHPEDRILIIDDFLAEGSALHALIGLVGQAGATLVGAGIAIEKAFQPGGEKLRAAGVRVESLARIKCMSDDDLEFCE